MKFDIPTFIFTVFIFFSLSVTHIQEIAFWVFRFYGTHGPANPPPNP